MTLLKRITAALAVLALLCLSSCKFVSIDEMLTTQPSADDILSQITTAPYQETTAAVITTAPAVQETTTASAVPETTAPQESPSYSVPEIVQLYADALNRTRGYTNQITVHHKEAFDASVVNAEPGGALTTKLANTVVGMVAKPAESDIVFSGGVGVNEEGETVPLLLPKKSAFSLPLDGIADAYAEQVNGMTHVVITLVPETVGFGEAPHFNSGAIGYLDTSELNFSVIKINSCTIDYTGSVIDAYIRPDGYINNVAYTINMLVNGSVTGLGITGSGTIDGKEVETWDMMW